MSNSKNKIRENIRLNLRFTDFDEKIFLGKKPQTDIHEILAIAGENCRFNLVVTSTKLVFSKLKIMAGSLEGHISVKKLGFVPAVVNVREDFDEYCYPDEHLYSDIVKDFDCEKIPFAPFINHIFCVTVSASAPPFSEEKISFEFYSEQNELIGEKKIKVNSVNLSLPENDIINTNWFHYDGIVRLYNVSPFSSEFYSILKSYLDLAVMSGQNMLYVPLFTPPLDTAIGKERETIQLVDVFSDGGKYSFDFGRLDYFIDFAIKNKIKYFEFSHLFTQWGAEAAPKIIASVNGKKKKIFGWETKSDGIEYSEFLTELLTALKQYIVKKGIIERCYFHISDEPAIEHLDKYKKCADIVYNALGNVKIIDAISNYEFYEKGIVKYPIVQLYAAEQFMERGVEPLSIYYCWEHYRNFLSNRMLNMPLQRTRVIGIQMYLNNVSLFLHWGFNFYNDFLSANTINPYEVTDIGGVFPAGDAFIVYPDIKNKAAVPSVRLFAIEEAFRDYRLLKALEAKTSREYVAGKLKKYGFEGFSVYPKSIEKHNEFILEIIQELV